MKLVFSIIVFVFCHLVAKAQFEFTADKWEEQRTSNLDSLLETRFITKSPGIEFEFRLWTIPSLVAYSDVFIMQFKSGMWSAKYFEYRNGKFFQKNVSQKGLDSLWSNISYNQVLTLPSQDSLRWLMRKYYADTSYVFDSDAGYSSSMMTDGTRYRFELFLKDKKRIYEYHCPADHLRTYPNIEQLYRAYAILILVRKHLSQPLVVC